MNGRWSNAACMGYAVKAMSSAGVDERVIEKVIAAMTTVPAEPGDVKGNLRLV